MRPKLILIATIVLVGTFCGSNIFADCIQDPVSFWTLDQETPPFANEILPDIVGTCGTDIACPVWDPEGIVGGALAFSGLNDGIFIADNGTAVFDREGSDSFSYSLWFRKSFEPMLKNEVLIGRWDETNRVHFWIGLNYQNGGASFNLWDTDSWGDLDLGIWDTANLADGQWHHIALVKEVIEDQDDLTKLYVDGEYVGALAHEYTGSFSGDAPLTIGWMDDQDELYFFNGSIDEVAIFDTALSAEIVRQIFDAGVNLGESLCTEDTDTETETETETDTETETETETETDTDSGTDNGGDSDSGGGGGGGCFISNSSLSLQANILQMLSVLAVLLVFLPGAVLRKKH